MISLRRPDRSTTEAMLRAADARSGDASPFSYSEVGATRHSASLEALRARYAIDRRRFALGRGRPLFEAARTALFTWRHFEIPWLELEGRADPVREGQAVATLTRVLGVWFLNPCRVVYREDAEGSPVEVAFAYGTLEGHVASGEERFSLRFDPTSGDVVFEILAFSRPASVLTRIGRPYMRRIQRRFAGDAAAALGRACGGQGGPPREVSIG
ncbi:DUF1990 domain-containing protein [Myxococcota bacterium]|nr:DUF1990 domain-containing protein [Myxococcota bacterium]